MPAPQLYIIDYRLHDQERSFIIRLERMDNAEAWHWASCDAGIGIIPKFGREKIRKVSRPMAERYGITEVHWRLSGSRETQPGGQAPVSHKRGGGEDVSSGGETTVLA
ncbi:DUF6555 family protein [Pseudomonas phoenicis]|uniref:DUF6555 family protein n=1 Tax=unclassified Pseudomonas TaxID=196821 RepID=UPI00399EFB49